MESKSCKTMSLNEKWQLQSEAIVIAKHVCVWRVSDVEFTCEVPSRDKRRKDLPVDVTLLEEDRSKQMPSEALEMV